VNALRLRWQALSMRIDGRSFRERLLLLIGAAAVTLSLLFVGLIEPEQKQQQLMLLTTSSLQAEIWPLREQLAEAQRLNQDGQDAELARLRATAAALQAAIDARESGLVAPARLIATLKTLLAAQPGLELLEVATAPAQAALPTPDEQQEATPPAPTFYKHGITLRVRGSYADLTAYLTRLESEPWTVQWESMRIDATRHPRLELTLKLNTLSREPTWAGL
jgi:MSHA biogenesis protein MshJ